MSHWVFIFIFLRGEHATMKQGKFIYVLLFIVTIIVYLFVEFTGQIEQNKIGCSVSLKEQFN